MVTGDALFERAQAWCQADPDPATGRQLQALIDAARAGDDAAGLELAERFAGRLAFGTAGLRGELGAGPMRMNRLVVRQAAAGLAAWLPAGSRVVIGFDARHLSDVFAADSARVLARAGHRVALFDQVCPTPTLAYAVRHLEADAGIMCTASHNPSRDNGYKVYRGDGAQIVPPVDTEIAAAIERAALAPVELAPVDHPAIETVGAELIEVYLAHVDAVTRPGSPGPAPPDRLRIAYTPLHGVGGAVVVDALARAGFDRVEVVVEQFQPDPDFPTAPFPNPEEPGALALVQALAERTRAQLVLANDPDADRLAVMVPGPGGTGWQALTGDQVGALLADHVLATTTGSDRLVVTTYVSSGLLARQAAAAGVHYAEVATGFKWVVRPGLDHPEWRFVFGYEEALGYSVDAAVRDKDGISAAVCFAQLVAEASSASHSVWDRLDQLGRRFGVHVTGSRSWRAEGSAGHQRMVAAMAGLRSDPPTQLGGTPVTTWRDLARPAAPDPPSDAVVLELADGSRVCLRPSGTEPKLKAYVEVVEAVADASDHATGPDDAAAPGAARARGAARVDQLLEAVGSQLLGGLADPAA